MTGRERTVVPSGQALGEVLALFRAQGDLTRADVMELTGLSRSTVNQRMDALIAADLLVPVGAAESTGGRRPSRFAFNARGRRLLVASAGASGVRAALVNLSGEVSVERATALDIALGPAAVLGRVEEFFDDLLSEDKADKAPLAGIGISVPGPVERGTGHVVSPPIMPGWDRFDIAGHFARFGVPVLVENDANAMALGEQRTHYPNARDLLMVKVSTGIGAGVIYNGDVIHGVAGAAGDIGHTTIALPEDGSAPLCLCGRTGCAEAYVGGWALLREMEAHGSQVSSLSAFVDLVRAGDALALGLARRTSHVVGELISGAVNLLNPSHVIIGGTLVGAPEVLLSGIRQAIYARCTPLSTKSIEIHTSRLKEHAGITGMALMCADNALADISSLTSTGSPLGLTPVRSVS